MSADQRRWFRTLISRSSVNHLQQILNPTIQHPRHILPAKSSDSADGALSSIRAMRVMAVAATPAATASEFIVTALSPASKGVIG